MTFPDLILFFYILYLLLHYRCFIIGLFSNALTDLLLPSAFFVNESFISYLCSLNCL